MTTVTIAAVHPTVTIVQTVDGPTELPTSWFPTMPKVGQQWIVNFDHIATDQEKLDQLNAYLAKD